MSKPHGNKESWLAALRADGAAFHTAVENGDLDADVPTCPGWTLRNLAFHVGAVYQRVSQHIVRAWSRSRSRPTSSRRRGTR